DAEMDVRVDQTGQHRCAPGVEERGVRRGKVWSDGRNSAVAHEDRDSSARRCAGAVDQPGVADEEVGSAGLPQSQRQDGEQDARADDDDAALVQHGYTADTRGIEPSSPRISKRTFLHAIMAGVRSMPVACRATAANAQTTTPGPQATSRSVSSGVAPLNSTRRCSASSSRIAGACEYGTACRVNWSTTTSS